MVASQYTPLALVWMIKTIVIDWPMGKLSFWRLPGIAQGLGLAHVQSDYYKSFGKLVGYMRGYHVEVIPDSSMNPVVLLHSPVRIEGLELSISKPNIRPQGKVEDFTTPTGSSTWYSRPGGPCLKTGNVSAGIQNCSGAWCLSTWNGYMPWKSFALMTTVYTAACVTGFTFSLIFPRQNLKIY